jgi:hypothetical protein
MSNMKLTSMKLPKRSKKDSDECAPCTMGEEREEYPYGLRLNFDKREVEKANLGKLQAGAMVDVQAIGKVIEVAITDRGKDKSRHRVQIQLQKIGVADKSSYDQSFKEASE